MNKRLKALFLLSFYIILVTCIARFIFFVCEEGCKTPPGQELILSLDAYNDGEFQSTKERLLHRLHVQPFNLISLIIFSLAIIHTFFAHYFTTLSKKWRARNIRLGKDPVDSFGVEALRFMGEVEVVFGLWVIPLFLAIAFSYSWDTAVRYVENIDYLEPMFVVVIMVLASSSPIVKLAEDCLRLFAACGGDSVKSWWWAILTIGPISGSLITEPGAMTISALLLSKQFYDLKPSPKFAYATLGLLFTNISVGGVFTHFAAPPVLMVTKSWHWDTPYMAFHFGWKAIMGILICNLTYYLVFRHEFKRLEENSKLRHVWEEKEKKDEMKIPFWISLVHLFFLAWTVVHNHYPSIFIGTFLLFLGFSQATSSYQRRLDLKPAILVGFFLAGLVVHGNLQGWWIAPVLSNASEGMLLLVSAFLTSFNDNAEITFLATLIPSFTDGMKYAVVAGAVTGGGLTVIANAPNPSGQAILGKYFDNGISAVSLFSAAIYPAVIMGVCFYLFRGI
ncbi:putative uncharacterized protein [Waddlia chondrophila 2032/99]|uniref:Na+/H+ antiporter n=2 Tax=Waddlia chondrophila TaxID=71667 RepID=D6YSM0_WADCW|nr:putative Na+/H+ antiporter [Waddlia chondrophila]ADI39065.1 conserved hypothetical protein [Waddlia chondrophila WSU 86-1044]CCB92177.1 putative uncharacterized protein [Waddlia chondrophila 2032/99]